MSKLIIVDTSALAKTWALPWSPNNEPYLSIKRTDENGNEYEYETTNLFNLFQIFKKVKDFNFETDRMVFCCDRKTLRKEVPFELIQYLIHRYLTKQIPFSVRNLIDQDIPTLIQEAINDGFIEVADQTADQPLLNEYKDGRKTNSENYKIQLNDAEKDLADCGFTVLFKDRYESDDLIKYISHKYKGLFDQVLVYTNDADMANILDSENKIQLRAISKWSHNACASTYEKEFKVPYNSITLYKATVGDKSDVIKGVKGFGPKSFPKLLAFAESKGYQIDKIRELDQEEEIIGQYFCNNVEQLAQGLFSLFLARPITDHLDLEINTAPASKEKTLAMLNKYEMKSIASAVEKL